MASTKFRNRTIREIDDFRHSAILGTPTFLISPFELQSTSTELPSRIHTSTAAPTGQPVYLAGHSSSLNCNWYARDPPQAVTPTRARDRSSHVPNPKSSSMPQRTRFTPARLRRSPTALEEEFSAPITTMPPASTMRLGPH
ncbi:hypothetical protein DPMN_027373 [Dreissena polymorpha]|uniref:Uncharacterized protein n=1 Tax=Dreissena polymorpha TaxID=45954 RepID=A0A9D4LWW1_DREPO|nr:hypothetical protein DPMN_027373 [Dreissena polymorpha]